MRPHKAEKSSYLERVLKEKENNKNENQIEALWKVELLEACSLEQTQSRVVKQRFPGHPMPAGT